MGSSNPCSNHFSSQCSNHISSQCSNHISNQCTTLAWDSPLLSKHNICNLMVQSSANYDESGNTCCCPSRCSACECAPKLVTKIFQKHLRVLECISKERKITQILDARRSLEDKGRRRKKNVRPNRMKTGTCPRYFRRVLKLVHRSSTAMTSKDTQSHSECAISQSF